MKKQLLILITLCISITGYSQSIGDTFVDNFITYEITSLSPNAVEVHGYDHNNGSTDVVIPATVTNSGTTYNVTSIGDDAFDYNGPTGKITGVTFTLPSNVTSIGSEAFRSQELTTVTIPSSVVSISTYAFWHNDITSVIIENGVESIGDHAFSTNQITSITIPNSVTNLGVSAFASNQLTSATLSNGLTSIANNVFGQNQIQSIVIPDNVTSIGSGAFYGNQLTSIALSNSLVTIDNSAFQNNNLTHVTVPASVTDIDFAAFRNNPLATVTSQATTPPNIFTPGINDSFWNRSVIDLTIPNGTSSAYTAGGWTGFNSVTEAAAPTVGDTFVDNFITYEITSLSPDEVEAINYNMAGGTMVNIPATVTNIIETYSVTSIGNSAFFNNQLTSVIIPSSVTFIGAQAFSANNSLASVICIATTPPTITTGGGGDTFGDGNGFGDRNTINLVITNNTTDEYVTDPGALWTGFKMVFEATSPTTVEVSNYDPANGTNVVIPATVTAGSVVFDVNRIEDSAFENMSLTSVTIPDSVTEIGISAFNTNSLTSVTIPDSVTLIGTTAFATNPISNLSLGANVTDIGIGAFVDNNLTDVTIPSNVAFIGLLAFGNNPLTSVTSYATTPPTITTGTNDTFAFNRSNIELHIPPGTLGAYVTDPGALWTGFNPVTQDASLSTSDFEVEHGIKIITNNDELKIISSGSVKLNKYNIYNISGAKIKDGMASTIAIDNLSSGIYILELKFSGGSVVKKFVK